MSLSERIQIGFIIVVSLLLLLGFVSVAYTLPKVSDLWREAYVLALLLSLSLITAFGLSAARMIGYPIKGTVVLWALELAIALTSIELVLVPYIHRKERGLPDGPGPN